MPIQVPSTWTSQTGGSAPSDMADFYAQTGGGTWADYYAWKNSGGKTPQQRTADTLASFIGSMGGVPQDSNMQSRLTAYLDAPTPTVNQTNRFEPGLSENEARLSRLLEDPNALQQTAAYKFRFGQGLDALNRQLGARGLLNSGNRLTETTKYGQDMASQEYENQFGRLRDLVGQYGQNWLGDKGANTARYAAESNVWNQRGDLLRGVTSDAAQNARGWADIWNTMNSPNRARRQSASTTGNVNWTGGLF